MQTDYPYIMKTQHGISLKLILVFSLLFLLSSCAKDEDNMPDTPNGNGLCTATLRLNVGTFGQNGRTGTRSVGGNEDENRINNIWVFQYDAKTGASLHVPVYLDNFDSNNIDVTLTLNEDGAQSLVCIVANVGEFVDDGENADTLDDTGAGGNVGTAKEKWALDENGNIKVDFDTYEKLRQQAIPEAVSRPFISSNMGDTGGKVIPMFGVSKAMDHIQMLCQCPACPDVRTSGSCGRSFVHPRVGNGNRKYHFPQRPVLLPGGNAGIR